MTTCPLQLTQRIGAGAFGTVSLVQTTLGPRALKYHTYEDRLNNLSELDILSRFRHPNLVAADTLILPQQCPDLMPKTGIGMVMPLAQRTLSKLTMGSLSEARVILFQLCSGLNFLHRNNYLHMDLKPNNILLYERGGVRNAVIADFGKAVFLDDPDLTFVGSSEEITVPYRPPENLAGAKEWSWHSDVWALGVVFLELLTGQQPTYAPPDYTLKGTLEHIEVMLGPRWNYLMTLVPGSGGEKENLIAILRGMLSPDINTRWSLEMVLANPFFTGLTPITGFLRPTPRYPRVTDSQLYAVKRALREIPEHASLGCYFMAMDLMFRLLAVTPDEARYPQVTSNAVKLAYLVYGYEDLILPAPSLIPIYLQRVIELQGLIAVPYLFHTARSLAQLENFRKRFAEIVPHYHELDVERIFSEEIPPFTVDLDSKYVELGSTSYRKGPGF